jgi:hypothetical protein
MSHADYLAEPWCCLTCFHKFPIGDAKIRGGQGADIPGNPHRLNCPNCRSVNIHPADGQKHTYGQRIAP